MYPAVTETSQHGLVFGTTCCTYSWSLGKSIIRFLREQCHRKQKVSLNKYLSNDGRRKGSYGKFFENTSDLVMAEILTFQTFGLAKVRTAAKNEL